MESNDPGARRCGFELALEELCVEWEWVGIDTSNIHRGIDKFGTRSGPPSFLVRAGAEGFNTACRKLGCEKTLETLIVRFADIADAAIVAIAARRLADAVG